MRCDRCPLSNPEDVCPEAEGKYGIEHKDGMLGCKHPRSWVEKRDEEYSNHLGAMGLDMGIEMCLTAEELRFASTWSVWIMSVRIIATGRLSTGHTGTTTKTCRRETDFWINCQSAYSQFAGVSVEQHIISQKPAWSGWGDSCTSQ